MAIYEGYEVGDEVRLAATFTAAGVPGDPTVVRFQARHRSATTWVEYVYDSTAPSGPVRREGVGVYSVLWKWTKSGKWYVRFVGEGALSKTVEAEHTVRRASTINV
jgi:hypothetical protein